MIDKLGLDGLGGASVRSEPAAPEPLGDSEGTATQVAAGLEPVAWQYTEGTGTSRKGKPYLSYLNPKFQDPNDMAEFEVVVIPLYSAATVEALVKERNIHAKVAEERFEYLQIDREQLAASQAREQQLREALKNVATTASVYYADGMYAKIANDALSLPHSDQALRQQNAKLLRGMVDLSPRGHYMTEILNRKADELGGKS